jgi:UPF0176 protein
MQIAITTCYRFTPLSEGDVARVKSALEEFAPGAGVRGLCLIGAEGVNLTVSGPEEGVRAFKLKLAEELRLSDLLFKDSIASKHPFLVFKVKVKDEIVTLGRPGLAPQAPVNGHLSPAEWHKAVQDPDAVVIDTRNDYEVQIGKFKTALNLKLKEFSEFPEAVRQAGIDKGKKVLMYCTGGIRCEKAILAMREQGYRDVSQLEGGILNYLKEYPDQEFEGECFVFDYRVAVDQKLQPTKKYLLCPHCGQPADIPLTCPVCATETVICRHCENLGVRACSKNCAHHQEIGSSSSRPHNQELRKRQGRDIQRSK